MAKQATLFRAWGGSKTHAPPRGKRTVPAASRSRPTKVAGVRTYRIKSNFQVPAQPDGEKPEEYGFEGFDDLDSLLANYNHGTGTGTTSAYLDKGQGASAAIHNLSLNGDIPGFDREAGEQWIYPTNYPVRDYQFNIVQKCLFQNTLVCLPTGLGKTFIAAVVMYNFQRWYPEGKVVFLAPTKPLVSQQIEACHCVMGLPQEHLAEMTGKGEGKERKGRRKD